MCKNWEVIETQKLISQRNDLCLLHFLYIFTGTVPQITLQLYAITVLDDNYQTKGKKNVTTYLSIFFTEKQVMVTFSLINRTNVKYKIIQIQ